MDEKMKVLIALGSSTAANCIPCFEHYYGKAGRYGITDDEIREVVDVAMQVKNGAQITIKNSIRVLLNNGNESPGGSCPGEGSSCCG